MGVKVTEVPAQTGLTDGVMETLTGSTGETVMVTEPEVAGFPETQDAFDVKTQVIASLFTGVYEYEALFVPTFVPFTFH